MQVEQIVQMESDKLELSGLFDERSQEPVKGLLLYLYTAVDIWMLLSPDDRRSVRNFNEFFEKERVVKLFLKELKSKKDKEKTAPAPHRKEKTIKENSQKTTHTTEGGASLFETRQKAFWDACLRFEPEYDRQLLLKFYCYWAEQVNGTELMLWETKKSWNMRLRLKAWSKKSYQLDDKAAALRLERAKGKKAAAGRVLGGSTAEEQALAAEREAANARREQELAASKAGAVSYEEYLNLKH